MNETERLWGLRKGKDTLGLPVPEFLHLKASIQYGVAGQRYRRMRERFWDRFADDMVKKDYAQANKSIETFMALRTHIWKKPKRKKVPMKPFKSRWNWTRRRRR